MEQDEKKDKKTSSSKSVNTTKKSASSKEKTTSSKKVETKVATTTAKRGRPPKNKEVEDKNTKSAQPKTTRAKKTTVEKEPKTTKKEPETKKDTVPTKEIKETNTPKTRKKVEENLESQTQKVKEEIPKIEETKDLANKEEKIEKVSIEQKNNQEPKEQNKKEKKYLEISVGAIICVVIIIVLLVLNVKLGKHAYGILTKEEKANANVETKNDTSVTQEIGNVLNNTSEIVQELKKKITFSPNVTASIYNTQGFNSEDISNELKLILGWEVAQEGKLISVNEDNQEIEALESKTMNEAIKKILGSNMQYQDDSFSNIGIESFSKSSKDQNGISYANSLYTSEISELTEELKPLIYQEIQKAVKYSEKIIVYVKTAFIDVDENDYKVYKNFNENKFKEQLLNMKSEELFDKNLLDTNTGEGTITLEQNSALKEIRKNLNTYKYIFTFDETTQDYYLSEFRKEH